MLLSTILLVASLVLFILAAVGVPSQSPPPRFNLMAGGLACWMLSILLGGYVHPGWH
jgi:hypothetical protein